MTGKTRVMFRRPLQSLNSNKSEKISPKLFFSCIYPFYKKKLLTAIFAMCVFLKASSAPTSDKNARRHACIKWGHVCAGANVRMGPTFAELLASVGARAALEAVVRYPPAVRCDPVRFRRMRAVRAHHGTFLFACVQTQK